MNNNINNNNAFMIMDDNTPTPTLTTTSSDMQICPVSPDPHDIFRPTLDTSDVSAGYFQPITTIRPHNQNPKKKRTKMIRIHNTNNKSIVNVGSGPSATHSGGTTKKKPDPSAPKITRPCTECGKRFWSWKALFGHMRCHPERPWRGINPPPNLLPPPDHHRVITEEDEYVAACLLMLANAPTFSENLHNINHTSTSYQQQQHHSGLSIQISDNEGRFECSSCKKVFGSHQALGGHRASHKNVKGCFAITRINDEELEEGEFVSDYDNRNVDVLVSNSNNQQQHKCSICLKIFSSGQALGGHKRCHWEKEDNNNNNNNNNNNSYNNNNVATGLSFRFDLNLPASAQDHDESNCSSSSLDLRLTL